MDTVKNMSLSSIETEPSPQYSHPVEMIQKNSFKSSEALRKFTTANIFGSHMMLRMQMDQALLSRFQRLPGLPSEYCGLDTIMNLDEDLGFEDYLNEPQNSVAFVDVHRTMERRLHL